MHDFEQYVRDRLEAQIQWYDQKSVYNHRMFNSYQTAIIAGASLVPVLSAVLSGSLRWITVVVSSAVAVLIGLLNLFKYQEKWIRHRAACEKLKREWQYYLAGVRDYHGLELAQRQSLFVERIEQLIEGEQLEWEKQHGRRPPTYVQPPPG